MSSRKQPHAETIEAGDFLGLFWHIAFYLSLKVIRFLQAQTRGQTRDQTRDFCKRALLGNIIAVDAIK